MLHSKLHHLNPPLPGTRASRLQAIALLAVRVDRLRRKNREWFDAGCTHSNLCEPPTFLRQGAVATEKMSSLPPGRVLPAIPYKLGGRKKLSSVAKKTTLEPANCDPPHSLTAASEAKLDEGNDTVAQADAPSLHTGTPELEERPNSLLVESPLRKTFLDPTVDQGADKNEDTHGIEEHGASDAAEVPDASTLTELESEYHSTADMLKHTTSTLQPPEVTNADTGDKSEHNESPQTTNQSALPEMLVDEEHESERPEPRIQTTAFSFEELRLQANQFSNSAFGLSQDHQSGTHHNIASSSSSIAFQGLDPSGNASPAPGHTGQRHVNGEMRPHEPWMSRVVNHQHYIPEDTRHSSFSTTSIQSPPVLDNFYPSNAPFPRPPPGLRFDASQQGPVHLTPPANSLHSQITNHRPYFDGQRVETGQPGPAHFDNYQTIHTNGQRSPPPVSARVSPGDNIQARHTRHEKETRSEGHLHRPSRLMDHLLHEWNIPELSDCTLHLKPSDGDMEPLSLSLHTLILAQSPRLRSLTKHKSLHQPLHIRLVSRTGALLDLEAFIFALKYLYGQPLLHLLDNRAYMYINDPSTLSNPTFRTGLALAYMTAGHFLRVEEIVHCGFDLVLHGLCWATMPRIISFITHNEMNTMWRSEHDKVSQTHAIDSSFPDGPPHPLVGRLVNAAIDFLADNWPVDFYFLPSIGNADDLAHLPGPPVSSASGAYAETHNGNGNGRLTAIRFGDMSSAPSPRHNGSPAGNQTHVVLSGILVSLPTGLLQHLFQHPLLCARLPSQRRLSAAREVVAERERRRRQALDVVLATSRLGAVAEGNLLGMEAVEVGEGGPEEFRITCRRVEA